MESLQNLPGTELPPVNSFGDVQDTSQPRSEDD
jgi:hypothetical protein